ncbi:hypothetical protein HAZT_HAZT003962 [Hyalella azteca]|nr:hypothetical protein HAZT_HAZT003962 [Hyalella azteca]
MDLERSILKVFSDATHEYFFIPGNTIQEPLLMSMAATPLVPLLFKISLFILVFLNSFIAFMLSWEHLKMLYNIFSCGVCIALSYHINCSAVHLFFNESLDGDAPSGLENLLRLGGTEIAPAHVVVLVTNYIIQALLCLSFIHLQLGIDDMLILKAVMIWAFLLPSGSMLVTFSENITLSVAFVGALIPLTRLVFTVISSLPQAFLVLEDAISYAKVVIPDGGLHTLIELEWKRINVPFVLRIFWSVRVANFVAYFLAAHLQELNTYNVLMLLSPSMCYRLFKSTMTYGCDTIIALLGMTSIVSYICHYVEEFFQNILLADDRDDRSMGTVSAILFFVLAEQSGLTILEDEKRFVRLCRNFCLLFTAMLYLVHNMVSPVLMNLGASRNPSLSRHVRALVVCAVLLLLPASLLYVLWSIFELSTWLLAVSTFSFQVIIKTLVTVFIYGIFIADSYYSLFWENLDDYVYYIKAFGNTVEFLFGIVLFFNGLWIYFFESGGAIRALMMCIHAYVNLWCEARNGWSAFIKRRNAVRRIASIPNATRRQLEEHDDVCTICFQRLNSAKITGCNHFYHELCLRKWLYVQDSCPLCHKVLYNNDPVEENAGGGIMALGGLVEDMDHAPRAALQPRRVMEVPPAFEGNRLAAAEPGGIMALGGLVEDMDHVPRAALQPRRVMEVPTALKGNRLAAADPANHTEHHETNSAKSSDSNYSPQVLLLQGVSTNDMTHENSTEARTSSANHESKAQTSQRNCDGVTTDVDTGPPDMLDDSPNTTSPRRSNRLMTRDHFSREDPGIILDT